MEILPYRLLTIDIANHALLVVDGPAGDIISELSYQDNVLPTALCVTHDRTRVYLPAAAGGGSGVLFTANLSAASLYRLPIAVPHFVHFVLMPDSTAAYAADAGGTLYMVDLVALAAKPCGRSAASASSCQGLVITDDGRLYSIWEQASSGLLAVFDKQANLLSEHPLPGVPTGITGNSELVLVTFTKGPDGVEGAALFRPAGERQLEIVTLIAAGGRDQPLYPSSPCLSQDGRTAYIINEDGQFLSVLELASAKVVSQIPVNRPLVSLALLHADQLAMVSTEGALMLIDLTAQRPLAITDTPRRLSPYFAILPAKPPS